MIGFSPALLGMLGNEVGVQWALGSAHKPLLDDRRLITVQRSATNCNTTQTVPQHSSQYQPVWLGQEEAGTATQNNPHDASHGVGDGKCTEIARSGCNL